MQRHQNALLEQALGIHPVAHPIKLKPDVAAKFFGRLNIVALEHLPLQKVLDVNLVTILIKSLKGEQRTNCTKLLVQWHPGVEGAALCVLEVSP